jgi:hypothetical protein
VWPSGEHEALAAAPPPPSPAEKEQSGKNRADLGSLGVPCQVGLRDKWHSSTLWPEEATMPGGLGPWPRHPKGGVGAAPEGPHS